MQRTKERTTWLGTYREKHGRWHRIPYVVTTVSTKGMTARGWAVLAAAAVLFVAVIVLEELFT